MPELRVDAIIFDMDGVVIDSGDVYARHWRRWGAEHGLDYDTDIAHVHPGRPPAETIRLVAPHLDAEAESVRFNESLDADGAADAIAAMPGAGGAAQGPAGGPLGHRHQRLPAHRSAVAGRHAGCPSRPRS